MKAFVVTHYGPDGLEQAEIPAPDVGPHDVLVEVRAASVNPLDMMIRNGEFTQLLKYKRPFILGHDVSGVVVGIGSAVTDFAIGDEVFGRPRDMRIGTFAELIAIDAADVARKPTSLTFEEAAAVPLVALAAWQALVDVAHLQSGQRVLVHAGAGGLGSTAIQVAKFLGAHVATTANHMDTDKLCALGADEVIDYSAQDFAEILYDYDVILDSLGGENLRKSLNVLKQGGIAISVVGPPDSAFANQIDRPLLRPILALMSRSVRRKAKKLGVRYAFMFMRANGAQLKVLASLYDSGELRPVLDRTFAFQDTVEAMTYVEEGKAKGKIVITRGGGPCEGTDRRD